MYAQNGLSLVVLSYRVAGIRLELFVVGVLDEDGDVTDVRAHSGVVVHHGDGCLLCAHLQERLDQGEKKQMRDEMKKHKSKNITAPPFLYHDSGL